MIDVKSTEIFPNNKGEDVEEVIRSLEVLYTTPQGTVPFDREFGIDIDILDNTLEVAKAKLTVQLIKKTKLYEPRAKVLEVKFQSNIDTGKLIPKVRVAINE